MFLGAHVPITGGVFNAPGHGQAIGAEAIQIRHIDIHHD